MLLRFTSSVRGAAVQKKFENRAKELPNTGRPLIKTFDEVPLKRMPFKSPSLEEQIEALGTLPNVRNIHMKALILRLHSSSLRISTQYHVQSQEIGWLVMKRKNNHSILF